VTRTPHDALFKRLFSIPEHVRDEVAALLPASVVEAIDWETLRQERAEVVAPGLEMRASDVIYRARLKDDGEALVWFAFEHQSTPDPMMAYRMLRLAVWLWERHLAGGAKRLPLFVPIVVFQGPGQWTAPRRLSELIVGAGALERALGHPVCELVLIVDALSLVPETEIARRTSSPFLRLGLWALRGRGVPMPNRVDAWADALAELARQRKGGAITSILRYHLYTAPLESRSWWDRAAERSRAGEERYMRTLADSFIDEGREEGLKRGRAEGREEGREEGIALGRADALRRIVERRFGAVPDDFAARIESADHATVDRWLDRAIDAASVEGVFADD
jgi:predicted transposase YdaD